MSLVRGQKLGQWHRMKTYSSLVTGVFELRVERRGGEWLGFVARTEPLGPVPLASARAPHRASREDVERAVCRRAKQLASELRKAARMAPTPEPEPDWKPEPPPPIPPQAKLTIAAVLDAERTLSANNVPPPYELRTMRSAIEGMLSGFGAMREDGPAEVPPDLVLEPGETFMGSVSHTRLIAVDSPTANGFVCAGKKEVYDF